MKCETIQQYILLEQSGELSDRQKKELDAHVEDCAQCRAFRTDSVLLSNLARVPEEETIVSEHTLYRIEQEAQATILEKRQPLGARVFAPRQREPLVPAWRPVLVYATALVLIIAAWAVWIHQPAGVEVAQDTSVSETEELAWDNGLDEEIEALDEMLVAALENWQESDTSAEIYPDDTSELARELLLLEEST